MGIPTFIAQMVGTIYVATGHLYRRLRVEWNNWNSVTRVHRMTDRWIIKWGNLPDGHKIKCYLSINHVRQQWRVHSCRAVIDDVCRTSVQKSDNSLCTSGCTYWWNSASVSNVTPFTFNTGNSIISCRHITMRIIIRLQHINFVKNRLWSLYSSASHKNMVIKIVYSFVK